MTIKDLAARTGYSVGTVSRVLNHLPNVSEKAREVILREAEQSGFRLNANAQQLKKQCTDSILVICKGKSNDFFDALLVAIQSRADCIGAPLIVDYVAENDNVVQRALRLCPEKKPRGVLFLGGNREEFLQDFHKLTLPCVLVSGSARDLPFPNLSSVSADDTQAARMAVSHLIGLGHRDIVVLGGRRMYSDIANRRYQGCLETLAENGIDFQENRDYEDAMFTYDDAYRATQSLLKKRPSFTALFAMSDVMAIGAIRALQDAGKRVPEDVSVMGFDGLPIGQYMVPRLSTMTQPIERLAERSMQLLRHSIQGIGEAAHEILTVSLENRESARRIG